MLLKVNMFLVMRSANFAKHFLSPMSDTIITKTFNKAAVDGFVQDGRGKRSKRRTNEDSVKQCIERYNPAVIHYGREKTPRRRYPSCDLTRTDMHKEYGTCQLKVNFHLSHFYKVFKLNENNHNLIRK